MLSRIVTLVVIVPVAIVLVALAVANRGPVLVTFDPFNPGNPALSLTMPLFVLVFTAIAIGLVVGSLATWLKQGRYRRLARQRSAEARADLRPPVLPHVQPNEAARPAIAAPNI